MKEILQHIAASPALEARWLNTLSLMESVGARKICLTVCMSHPTAEVFQHFADEARHAYAFKRLSELVGGGDCSGHLCRDEALGYFQGLDASIVDWIGGLTGVEGHYPNYLLVTSLIEKRAMKLYPLYLSVTKNPQVKDELKKIILEESSHKPAIDDAALAFLKAQGFGDMKALEAIEENLFTIFLGSLQKELRIAA